MGLVHPDEVFQMLEPAFVRVYGFGQVAWEWQVGLRNWAVPGMLALLLELCSRLGIDDPQAHRAVLEIPQYLLHVAMLAAVFRMSARRIGPERALWSSALVGSYGVVLHFAGRTMSESYSAAFLVWAFERLDTR
jgi:hypothetical protein